MISRKEAWEEAERHRADIERFARGCRIGREDAEDLATNVMIKVVGDAQELGAISYLMFRAMNWAIVDFCRARKSKSNRIAGLAKLIRSGAGTSWDAMILVSPSDDAGVEEDEAITKGAFLQSSARNVTHRQIAEFINIEALELRDYTSQMTPEYAQVIWCDYWRFSAIEGAELLGITVPAYKARLYRGRKELRGILASEMPGFATQNVRTATEE